MKPDLTHSHRLSTSLPSPQRSGAATCIPHPAPLTAAHIEIHCCCPRDLFLSSPTSRCMVPPQLRDTGLQQSSTATGASRPLPLDVPNGDTTTTPNPSVATTLNPSVTTDHRVIERSLPDSGSEPERMKIIDEAPNEIFAAGKAPNKLKSSNDATRKHQVNFADSIESPRGNTRLPPGFCSQCLACHQFKSGKRTYHIRSFRENLAMHEAISLGKLSKVDPWEAIVKEFKPPSPKPAPEQAQQQPGLCSRTLSEAGERYLDSAREGLSGIGQVNLLLDILKAEFHAEQRMQSAIPAQQAPEAQRFGPSAAGATTGGISSHYMYTLPTYPRPRSPQPTGPPPKKRKAGNANKGSGRAYKGARFGGAHTAITQGAGGQRTSAAQTPQPTTNPASNTDERQRASNDPIDNVTRTSQTNSLNITNVPTTGASPPAKGEAAVAKTATDEAAQQAADGVAAAKKAASNNNKPT